MAKQNTHLEHLEDDILNQGSAGGRNAIKFLNELGVMLTEPRSTMRVTTKWDGAPAVICGFHPTNGGFFVGTKGVFAQVPKICQSFADVDALYTGNLAAMLKECLKQLPKLPFEGVIQGDLLFTTGKSSRMMGGEQSITFQPNTITYAVPTKSDLGRKVARAKLGIVFHTTYNGGPELRDMTASFGVDVSKMQNVPDVMVFSSDFSTQDATLFTPAEFVKYQASIRKAEGSLKQASKFLDVLQSTGEGKFMLASMFKIYFNSFIRTGRALPNARAVAAGFSGYYKGALQKEIDSKKQEKTKEKYQKIMDDGLKFINAHSQSIYMTVASYMNLAASKTIVIRQLEKVQGIGTFIKTENGFKVTAPEGFVAIRSGAAIKLVDRLEFSRANFTVEKNWG